MRAAFSKQTMFKWVMRILMICCFGVFVSCSNDQPNPAIELDLVDWNPDSVVVDSFELDINNDAIHDIQLKIEKSYQGTSPSGGPYYNYFTKVIALHPEVQLTLGKLEYPPQQVWNCLHLNTPITSDLTWGDAFVLKGQVIAAGNIGVWDINTSEGFVGIRYTENNNDYFGWIKLSVDYDAFLDKRYRITCYEYAFSRTENLILLAGQKH
jgi:hypothetical protein